MLDRRVDARTQRLDVFRIDAGERRDPQLIAAQLSIRLGVEHPVGSQYRRDRVGIDIGVGTELEADSGAANDVVLAGAAAAFSTSARVTCPREPVGLTASSSTPSSMASLRVAGLALIRLGFLPPLSSGAAGGDASLVDAGAW